MGVLLVKRSVLGKKTVMVSKEEAEAGVKAGTVIKRGGVYVEAANYSNEVDRFKTKKEKAKKKADPEPVEEEEVKEEKKPPVEKKPETYETKVMTPSPAPSKKK